MMKKWPNMQKHSINYVKKITSFWWLQNPDGSNKNETPYWNDERDSQILSAVFENLLSFKGKLNVPIICGEYAAWPKKIDMDTRAGKSR